MTQRPVITLDKTQIDLINRYFGMSPSLPHKPSTKTGPIPRYHPYTYEELFDFQELVFSEATLALLKDRTALYAAWVRDKLYLKITRDQPIWSEPWVGANLLERIRNSYIGQGPVMARAELITYLERWPGDLMPIFWELYNQAFLWNRDHPDDQIATWLGFAKYYLEPQTGIDWLTTELVERQL